MRDGDLTPAQVNTIRAAAWLDLAFTAPLALPFTAPAFITILFELEKMLAGSGVAPPFASLHWFLTTLAGTLGVLWAMMRIQAPSAGIALVDMVARCWVSSLILYFVLFGDAPRILLAFVVTELGGALAQWWVLRKQ